MNRARQLFPFPILGINTDNGAEFINEDVVAYCAQEHLTFTRGRPEVKNDQCRIEQKTGCCQPLQYPALQRAVRKMRAYLRRQTADQPWPLEMIHGPLGCFRPRCVERFRSHAA